MPALGAVTGEALTLARGGRLLFRDLNFEISSGEVLSLEGPNGAGKTSLLRLIAGFLAPQSGRCIVRTAEDAAVSDPEDRARFVTWLGHQDGIKPQFTPVELLRFFAQFYAGGDPENVLDRVGLRRVADIPAQYLSAGQKKRLALARLAIASRPLWLLDEPFAALDRAGRVLVGDLMAQHCAGGGIVVAATHEPLGLSGRQLTLGGGA